MINYISLMTKAFVFEKSNTISSNLWLFCTWSCDISEFYICFK